MFELDAVKIRGLMFEKNFNATELAKIAGFSRLTASKVIRDGAKATFETIRKLADAFQVDGNTLILSK